MNDVLYSLTLIILIGSAHVKFAGRLKDDVRSPSTYKTYKTWHETPARSKLKLKLVTYFQTSICWNTSHKITWVGICVAYFSLTLSSTEVTCRRTLLGRFLFLSLQPPSYHKEASSWWLKRLVVKDILSRLTRADERVVFLSGFRPPQWHYGINWLAWQHWQLGLLQQLFRQHLRHHQRLSLWKAMLHSICWYKQGGDVSQSIL